MRPSTNSAQLRDPASRQSRQLFSSNSSYPSFNIHFAQMPPLTTTASATAAFQVADEEATEFQHPLGALPHTIRGFLSTFHNMLITGQPYDCCSACSPKILNAYKKDGWKFVKKAINEKGFVEELSGLAELQRKAEALADNDVDWDEGEDGDGELL